MWVCVCVCACLCLSSSLPHHLFFRFAELDMDTHTQTQARAHTHTSHLSAAQDPELLSLWFKVKEMQQVNWTLRGQRSLITLFLHTQKKNGLLFFYSFLLYDSDDRDISLICLSQASHLVPSDLCHFLLSDRKSSPWRHREKNACHCCSDVTCRLQCVNEAHLFVYLKCATMLPRRGGYYPHYLVMKSSVDGHITDLSCPLCLCDWWRCTHRPIPHQTIPSLTAWNL